MEENSNLISAADAAVILGIKEVAVKRIAREKLLPSVAKGKDFFFKIKDVEAYLEMSHKMRSR